MGIEPTRLRVVAQRHNVHWFAATRSDRMVLRRYAARRTRGEVEYELRVLEQLRARGWPVAVALAPALELGGSLWCVFTYLAGRARVGRSASAVRLEQRARGKLLAQLHVELAELSALGQRPGWRRTDQCLHERAGLPALDEVLRAHERRAPEEGRVLRTYTDAARVRLVELAPHAPAPIVVHGDFAPWNLRFARGALSGILDFDLVRLDLRVADFALAWRGRHGEVLRGYEEVSPLAPVERELIVPVYWAWLIAAAVAGLDAGETTAAWAVEHLLRTRLAS